MDKLTKEQIRILILEAVQELQMELKRGKKDKKSKQPSKDDDTKDYKDVRKEPIRVGKDKKFLLLDKEKTPKDNKEILETEEED